MQHVLWAVRGQRVAGSLLPQVSQSLHDSQGLRKQEQVLKEDEFGSPLVCGNLLEPLLRHWDEPEERPVSG